MKKVQISIFMVCGALVACMNKTEVPATPIFEGTTEIKLSSPSDAAGLGASGSFLYSVPSEVKYLVFGLFNAKITTSGKTVTNPSAFVYGSRDGLSDFVRGQQARSAFHSYNQTTKDFDAATVTATCTPGCYWAVWGYDQYGNITHSSGQRQVTVP
ncbi:MAG: hypothetical protein KF713_19590 [Turneriella sp.]|nr:hypothetical protein [Turneriella sp.]